MDTTKTKQAHERTSPINNFSKRTWELFHFVQKCILSRGWSVFHVLGSFARDFALHYVFLKSAMPPCSLVDTFLHQMRLIKSTNGLQKPAARIINKVASPVKVFLAPLSPFYPLLGTLGPASAWWMWRRGLTWFLHRMFL